jgi:hypothetical protein
MDTIRRDSSSRAIVAQFTTNFDVDTAAKIPAVECLMLLSDLTEMAAYIRAHVGESTPHALTESGIFVTYDLGFQLQALAGELESWDDGYFTLRWMFYCGPSDRSQAAFYTGIEARVDVAEALRWSIALDTLAKSTG